MRAALLCAAWAAVDGQTPGAYFYKLRDKDVGAPPTGDPRLAGGFGAPGDAGQEAMNALHWGEHEMEAVRLTSRRLGHGFDASPDKPRPRARAFHATGIIEDKFFVFGGVGKDVTDGGPLLLNDLHFYDQQRGGWSGELKRTSCCRDGVAPSTPLVSNRRRGRTSGARLLVQSCGSTAASATRQASRTM